MWLTYEIGIEPSIEKQMRLTPWDVSPNYSDVSVSVWSTLFMEESQAMHHFMNDDSLTPAPSCKPYSIVSASVSNWRRATVESQSFIKYHQST